MNLLWLEQKEGRRIAELRTTTGVLATSDNQHFWKICTCAYVYVYEPNNISMDCILAYKTY